VWGGTAGGQSLQLLQALQVLYNRVAHLHGASRSVHHTNADIAAGGGVTQVKNRDMRHVLVKCKSGQGRVRVESGSRHGRVNSSQGRIGVELGLSQVKSGRGHSLYQWNWGVQRSYSGGCSGYNGAESMVECRALYRWIYKR